MPSRRVDVTIDSSAIDRRFGLVLPSVPGIPGTRDPPTHGASAGLGERPTRGARVLYVDSPEDARLDGLLRPPAAARLVKAPRVACPGPAFEADIVVAPLAHRELRDVSRERRSERIVIDTCNLCRIR